MSRAVAVAAVVTALVSGCQPEPIGVAHLAVAPAGDAIEIEYVPCPGERVEEVRAYESLPNGDEVDWVVAGRGPTGYIAARHDPGDEPSPAERYPGSLPVLDEAELTVVVETSMFGTVGLSSIEFGDLFTLEDEVYVADGNVKGPETFRADAEFNC